MNKYALAVIGAGPAGYVAAIRAGQLGLKTAIVERRYWGGVCLNVGCIPTKSLIRNAEVVETVTRQAREFGLFFDNLSVDYGAAFKRSRQVSERLVRGVTLLLKKNGIESYSGSACVESPRQVRVTPENGEPVVIAADNIIIATGARPRSLPGRDSDGEKIVTYREAILSPNLPESAVIIGGGPIGVEFAYIWNSYGVKVTLIEMLDHLLPTEDPEASAVVERAYQKRGIAFHTGSRVERIEIGSDGVALTVKTPKGEETVRGERALVAIGFRPNVEEIGLEKLGVARADKSGFIEINERMETSVPGIYAVGDVTGKLMLAHAGSAMGIAAAEAIAGKNPEPIDYRMIPRCVYCRPQVASFGCTGEEALREGNSIETGKFPFLANGKALGLNERDGFVKIMAEKDSGKIRGASLVGPDVTELLPELTLAQSAGLTIADIARNIHAHPTLSEAVQEAALAALGRAIHL